MARYFTYADLASYPPVTQDRVRHFASLFVICSPREEIALAVRVKELPESFDVTDMLDRRLAYIDFETDPLQAPAPAAPQGDASG